MLFASVNYLLDNVNELFGSVTPLFGNVNVHFGNVNLLFDNVSGHFGSVNYLLDNVNVLPDDVNYLLDNVNGLFGDVNAHFSNVSGHFNNVNLLFSDVNGYFNNVTFTSRPSAVSPTRIATITIGNPFSAWAAKSWRTERTLSPPAKGENTRGGLMNSGNFVARSATTERAKRGSSRALDFAKISFASFLSRKEKKRIRRPFAIPGSSHVLSKYQTGIHCCCRFL